LYCPFVIITIAAGKKTLYRADAASLRVAHLGELSTSWSDSSSGILIDMFLKE
jgi:hypothetical protein